MALMGLKVNLADQTVYPESFRMCFGAFTGLGLVMLDTRSGERVSAF